jgi:DNA-binding transcriptional LysR family regulator
MLKDGGMTLDQLKIFIAVAEREHLTQAADALGLAPPSVSAAVASREREFGTKLFHRVGRGIAATEGGKLLLDEARDLVSRAEAVKLAMREFTGLARGGLVIKASQTIANHFLPPRLVDFHQAYPGVALVVSVGNSTEVIEAIIRGDIELGFIESERRPPLDHSPETHGRRSNHGQMGSEREWLRDAGRLCQDARRARRPLRKPEYRHRTPVQ